MTPKEKARELVDKYFLEIEGADRYAFNLPSMNLFIAKQCAIIAVDEIIDLLDHSFIRQDEQYETELIRYWQEVKQEIEKL